MRYEVPSTGDRRRSVGRDWRSVSETREGPWGLGCLNPVDRVTQRRSDPRRVLDLNLDPRETSPTVV